MSKSEDRYTIHSDILGEDRQYSVHVPPRCRQGGASSSCAVLYLLDGDSHLSYASAILQRMSSQSQIPEMILVAVSNVADRVRDLTPTHTLSGFDGQRTPEYAASGGANAFLDFLQKELIPEIERRHAPMPYRVIAGHSLGGLTALHGLIERPALFHAYVVVDPTLWWDDLELVRRAESRLKNRTDCRNKIYTATAERRPGGKKGAAVLAAANERLAKAMQANASPHFRTTMKEYPGEDHGTVALPALYDGLRFIFEGYKHPPESVAERGLESVVAYYREYLGAHGIALEPPGGVLADMVSVAKENGETQQALEILEYSLALNPQDPTAHFMLASSYQEAGKADLAIEHYQRTLEIAPQFATYVQPRLDALTNQRPR